MNKSNLPSPKKRLLKLQPGYYAIRYGCDVPNGPIATVGYTPSIEEGSFQAIGARRGGQVIMSPESPMALVHVEGGPATVSLSLFFPDGSADTPVRFDVELLSPDLPQANEMKSLGSPKSLVHLSGHVEMVGDTETAAGDWLGQQKGQRRIEGFAVHWPNRPMNVDLSYGCTVAGFGQSPSSLTGGFVGTRQKMAPITSVWMELKGSEASAYKLNYKASFSVSGVIDGRQGERISGIHDKDVLVGLFVEVSTGRDEADKNTILGGSQVKTFRAQ